jgi:hypothetical protein
MTGRTATALLVIAGAFFIGGAALAIFGADVWWKLMGVLLYAPAIGVSIWAGRARKVARDAPDRD